MDLAVPGDRLQQRVLADDPVDRDRHALLDLIAQAGKAAVEFAHEPDDGIRLHLEFGLAAGEVAGDRSRAEDAPHAAPAPPPAAGTPRRLPRGTSAAPPQGPPGPTRH